MNDRDRENLIEAVCSPYRERDPFGRILPSPVWWDLCETDREAAFDAQLASREFERSLAPRGLSATADAVLARARWLPQFDAG